MITSNNIEVTKSNKTMNNSNLFIDDIKMYIS